MRVEPEIFYTEKYFYSFLETREAHTRRREVIEAVASLSTDVSEPAILFLSPLPDYSQLFRKKRARSTA